MDARTALTQELAALSQFFATRPQDHVEHMDWYVAYERVSRINVRDMPLLSEQEREMRRDYAGAFMRDLVRLRKRYGQLIEELAALAPPL